MTIYQTAGGQPNVAAERLKELLKRLAEQGLSQSAVARRVGVPAQYLSDVKHGLRPMTELFARRLGETFDVNFEWLLGNAQQQERPALRLSGAGGERIFVPMLEAPIVGDPRKHPSWNGAVFELAGVAAARAAQAEQPYVLRFGDNDRVGRLKKGDLILVSQSASDSAELSVVLEGRKLFLARRRGGKWIRATTGEPLRGDGKATGHCIGVVWSPLS